ncbi:MAG: hypothetical protein JOZ41_02905 [Chloroflexi bacterium]|nr:hypothetical protein [Chloroflexota bacterium]
MDAWIHRLKDAYTAGYYQTEPAQDEQTPFPWRNKTCKDCPFWSSHVCQVLAEYRAPTAHTCSYFDPWNREAAQAMMRERQWLTMRAWWERFNQR